MNQTDDLLYLYTMNVRTEIKLYLAIGAKDSYRLKPQTAVGVMPAKGQGAGASCTITQKDVW